MASSASTTAPTKSVRHRIGVWPVVVSVLAITGGAFVGQLWLPLGLFVAGLVGVGLAGLVEGAVGVLGTAVGIPVLRSVGATVLHSPIYLPAALFGMAVGAGLRWRFRSRRSAPGHGSMPDRG